MAEGSIPPYCCGTLFRTGPSSDQLKTSNGLKLSAHHWFDGFAQIYRFQILPPSRSDERVRVLFNTRSTTDVGKPGSKSLADVCSFGQSRDPCETFFEKVASTFYLWHHLSPAHAVSPNINVVLLEGNPGRIPIPVSQLGREKTGKSRLLTATTDSNGLLVVDADTLEMKAVVSQTALLPSLQGPVTASHYCKDPFSGDLFNFNLTFQPIPLYRVFQINAATGRTEILATIFDAPPAFIHSFFVTEHYVVLCVWGARYAFYGIKVLWTQNVIDSLDPLDPKQECLWYVIDRTAARRGVVTTYTSQAFFAFHTVNAYEEESLSQDGATQTSIVADVATYDDLSVLKKYYYDNIRSNSSSAYSSVSMAENARARLTRFRLPNVPVGGCTHWFWGPIPSRTRRRADMLWRMPSWRSVETPSINPSFTTKKHRFVYGITNRGLSTFFDGLAKVDLKSQTLQVWDRHGHTPGEPVFVHDPEAEAGDEDAGVLLTVVLDGHQGTSYLLVLDAKTMKEVGRAESRQAVAFGFHGLHIPSQG